MSHADLHLNTHISKQFNAELDDIRQRVLTMGGLVEQQVSEAVRALTEADGELGEQVANRDYKVNAMEVGIDEECTRVLARRQPAATDLRLIINHAWHSENGSTPPAPAHAGACNGDAGGARPHGLMDPPPTSGGMGVLPEQCFLLRPE